jgi:nitroreductase
MDKPAPTDHPIHELLSRRWSPRAFADRPVDRATLLRLLEAARWAPSSYNEQPWAFLLATREQPEEHARLLGCLIEFNQTWAARAPVLILSLAHRVFAAKGMDNRHAWHDVGLAVGCLTMQATVEGLGVHQMAGILPDKVRTTFDVPADWEPVSGIAIGYHGDPATLPDQLRQRELAPRSRKGLPAFVFSGHWGEPAPVLTAPGA